jgi:N-acetylmuramoyl-L-alanine amidase
MARVAAACLLLLFAYTGMAEANWQYTVKSGDTLFLIGKRYGVSVANLKAANGLKGDSLYKGQKLTIPTGDGNVSGSSGVSTYKVQKGDTLFLIARKFGVSVNDLKRYNNFWRNTVYPGQVLKIPARSSRPAVTVSRGVSSRDLDLLARAVYSEGRGEIYEGQVAIAAVILNRLKHPDFPKSIAGIIYQPGAFSAVDDGQINLKPDGTAYKAAQDALKGWDPTDGAIYYWNPAKATSKWIWSRPITKRIGNHVFAK